MKSKKGIALFAGLAVALAAGVALASGGEKALSSDDGALQIIAQLNAALYQVTDPMALRSLAAQALAQSQSGAYSQEMAARILAAVKVVSDRADALST